MDFYIGIYFAFKHDMYYVVHNFKSLLTVFWWFLNNLWSVPEWFIDNLNNHNFQQVSEKVYPFWNISTFSQKLCAIHCKYLYFYVFPVFSRIRCTAIKLRQICVCSRVDDWKVEFLLTCSRIKTCQVEMDLGLDSARFIGKQTAKIVIWLKSISADDEEIRCIILVESGMLCAAAAFGWAARLKYMRELMRSSLLSRFSQYLV